MLAEIHNGSEWNPNHWNRTRTGRSSSCGWAPYTDKIEAVDNYQIERLAMEAAGAATTYDELEKTLKVNFIACVLCTHLHDHTTTRPHNHTTTRLHNHKTT